MPAIALCAWIACGAAQADEHLFGYLKGAEPLPRGAVEFYEILTSRTDKGTGHYHALDSETEIEYGFTDRLSGYFGLRAMAIDTRGLLLDAYIPADEDYGLRTAGVETAVKYNFRSPAKHRVGVASSLALSVGWLDAHSGQDKSTISIENRYQFQTYLRDGRVILVGNLGFEATRAKRDPVPNLPPGFEWPTEPEMEIGLQLGLGASYRFAPGWFLGLEAFHDREYETEVDVERWSWQAGPTIHYGGRRWWSTFTWFPQLEGGGPTYDGQPDTSLHLIEKTEQELRLKVGFNF